MERELLIKAKNAIDHARKWIKNIDPDYMDNGNYRSVSEELESAILKDVVNEYSVIENLKETHAALCFSGDYVGSLRWQKNRAALLLVTKDFEQYG